MMKTLCCFLSFLALLSLVLRTGEASLPAQVYWTSHFPNTLMPPALLQLLQTNAGITSNFLQFMRGPESQRDDYAVGYWAETKSFEKNYTFNTTTVYFLRDNLRPYKRMNTVFTKSSDGVNFLPKKEANSIPFSTSKFAEILNYTSVKPNSKEAEAMKQTIEQCEAPGIEEEDKHCATSLESLVDYIISKLGKRVLTQSNEVEKEEKQQVYTIQEGIKIMGDKHNIVCHKEKYAYAVYYCHNIKKTEVYRVPMRGEDGSEAKSVVVCRLDTSDWNPQHFAFQVLNVKPGGPPVCHFVNSDTIVWFSF